MSDTIPAGMRGIRVAVMGIGLAAALPAVAQAATIGYFSAPSLGGHSISYAAAPGERNDLTVRSLADVRPHNLGFVFTDGLNVISSDGRAETNRHCVIGALAAVCQPVGGLSDIAGGGVPFIGAMEARLGAGNDTARIQGEDGTNVYIGDASGISLYGDAGADRLFGGADTELLDGGTGDDYLLGGAKGDLFLGGDGNDVLDTRDGLIEVIDCGAGADRAFVDAGEQPEGCEQVEPS
jgi:hemolysin type calcium-binding protein